MRVWGDGTDMGATRASQIDLTTTGVDGPGQAAAYLTTSFGQPEIAFASSDGFNAAGGYDTDTAQLPADAHQHMSWAFTAPGVYRVHFRANLRTTPGATPAPVGEGTAVFAVGTPPEEIAASEGRRVLSAGHADITVNLTTKRVELASDADALSGDEASAPCVGASSAGAVVASTMECTDLDHVVIEVPTRALTTIPGEASFRFIGEAGANVYMLPQAVLGKHVHGDIDPHLWHDVHNAQAYVRVIRDSLISVDPGGEATYRTNAAAYLTRLDELDATMASTIATIPSERRKLVTPPTTRTPTWRTPTDSPSPDSSHPIPASNPPSPTGSNSKLPSPTPQSPRCSSNPTWRAPAPPCAPPPPTRAWTSAPCTVTPSTTKHPPTST